MTALLVIDMQEWFAAPAAPVLANTNRLIAAVHALPEGLAAYTQHGHTPAQIAGDEVSQLVRVWGPAGSIKRFSPQWELLAGLEQPAEGDIRVQDKDTYDAFIHTGLEAALRARGVQRVIVCGVLTNFCCETTARSAFNRGFETILVSDACGASDRVLHEGTLRAIRAGFGEVLTTAEVLARLE